MASNPRHNTTQDAPWRPGPKILLVGARDVLPTLLKAGYEVVIFETAERALRCADVHYDAAIVGAPMDRGNGIVVATYLASEGICPLVLHAQSAKGGHVRQHLTVLCMPGGRINEAELLEKLETAVEVTREVRAGGAQENDRDRSERNRPPPFPPQPTRVPPAAAQTTVLPRPSRAAPARIDSSTRQRSFADIESDDVSIDGEATAEVDMTQILSIRRSSSKS